MVSLLLYLGIFGPMMKYFGKTHLLLILLLLILDVCLGQEVKRHHEISVTASHFTIIGSTNINRFECTLEDYTPSDTLEIRSTWNNKTIQFDNLVLTYPVSEFDCGLEAMNRDMQHLLQSDQYPVMILHIKSIDLKPNQQAIETLYVTSDVALTIAGVAKPVKITEGMVINHSESSLTFSGEVSINMKDFHMEPPVRLWGMVQVDEMLQVKFAVRMEVKNL